MELIYVDTGALIALSDRNDKNFKRYKDQRIDLTDCLSFSIMERMNLNTAFTFDSDFQTHGFRMVPA
jgi:predicted nucleic acid-binding protein